MNVTDTMHELTSTRVSIKCEITSVASLFCVSADNIRKAPRMTQMKDFSVFSQPHDQRQPNRISPQLILACFQYLSTCKYHVPVNTNHFYNICAVMQL